MSDTNTPFTPAGAPVARDAVEQLKAYSAPLEGRRELLRLDFNENTIGPSPLVAQALRGFSSEEIAVYPEYDGLREAVVQNLQESGCRPGLTPDQVGLFNGVDAAIHAVFQAYGDPGDRLLTTAPTFGYYSPCARMQGMTIEAIPYEGESFAFPLAAVTEVLQQQPPRLLLICNPNNPTGTRLAPDRIIALATTAPQTLVVVDELYEAFTGDSVLPSADFAATPNLLVLRSLAKTAGLAGLRIGFAIGHADVVDRVGRVTGPYDVNSVAVAAAFSALADQSYVDAYVSEVLRAREWTIQALREAGVRHHCEGGNYLLIWPKRAVAELDAELRQAGILVRSMAGKALIDETFRVSIGTTSQMQRFVPAFLALDYPSMPA
ncbi:pyridoxal phosphate-dependent aminotransferase [Synechococcus sp. MIT S1220]|uniref:pyridoxal phosphate-dependent aminotransferase n=1 Tax=Synechococcus sp. MIT S1220 TaxID=3082549 RepID=UPI0039B06433